MSDGYASLDAHAFVDNSLGIADRASFEAVMRRDGRLRSRVEAWQAQNEAIRLAFGAAPKPRLAPALGRHSNENTVAPKATPTRPVAAPQAARVAAPEVAAARRARWRAAAVGAFVLLGAMVSFGGGPADPRDAMMQHASTALSALAPLGNTRLDFVSDDPRAVSAWLAPRFARLDADRLSPPGWSLLGVRVTPGLASAAALVLFEDATGQRAGLLLEPMDALPDLAPIGANAADEIRVAGAERGFAYAAVGPKRSGVAALIPPARRE